MRKIKSALPSSVDHRSPAHTICSPKEEVPLSQIIRRFVAPVRILVEQLFNKRCQEMKISGNQEQMKRFADKILQQFDTDSINLHDMSLNRNCITIINQLIRNAAFVTLTLNPIEDACATLSLNMVSLTLSNCGIGSKGFQLLFRKLVQNQTIYALNVGNPHSSNRNRIGKAIKDLCAVLQYNQILGVLDIRCCGITKVSTLNKGLQANSTLTYLNLSDNDIHNEIVVVPSLEWFEMQNNHMDVICIAEQMRPSENPCHIAQLNLSGCKVTLVQLQVLFEQLERNQYLKILHLDNNMLIGDNNLCISTYLVYNNTLEELSLRNCALSLQFLQQLASGMSKNSKLKSLNISKNLFGNEGALAMVEGFTGASNMRSISMKRCGINDESGLRLFKQFLMTPIVEFNFQQNLLGDKTALYAIQLLQKKRNVTLFKFDKNMNSYQTQTQIEKLIADNKVQQRMHIVPSLRITVQKMSNFKEEQGQLDLMTQQILSRKQIARDSLSTAQSQVHVSARTAKDRTVVVEDRLQETREQMHKLSQQQQELDKRVWDTFLQLDNESNNLLGLLKSENNQIQSITKQISQDQNKVRQLQAFYKQNLESTRLQNDIHTRKLKQAEAEFISLQKQMDKLKK